MFKSQYDGTCECAVCERNAGRRSYELWLKLEKHDYSVLLDWRFWLKPEQFKKDRAVSGAGEGVKDEKAE